MPEGVEMFLFEVNEMSQTFKGRRLVLFDDAHGRKEVEKCTSYALWVPSSYDRQRAKFSEVLLCQVCSFYFSCENETFLKGVDATEIKQKDFPL